MEERTTVQDPEDYDEAFQKLIEAAPLERRLAGLSLEERLTGLSLEERLTGLSLEERLTVLSPEERLAGLSPYQILLALPEEALRSVSDECLATLPPEVQDAIRKRTGR